MFGFILHRNAIWLHDEKMERIKDLGHGFLKSRRLLLALEVKCDKRKHFRGSMQEWLAKSCFMQMDIKLYAKCSKNDIKGSILCVLHLGLVYLFDYGEICTQKDS